QEEGPARVALLEPRADHAVRDGRVVEAAMGLAQRPGLDEAREALVKVVERRGVDVGRHAQRLEAGARRPEHLRDRLLAVGEPAVLPIAAVLRRQLPGEEGRVARERPRGGAARLLERSPSWAKRASR